MKFSKPEKINPDLPGIVILSHGPFAVALLETAQLIFGEADNIAAFSLEPEMISTHTEKHLSRPMRTFQRAV